jgi:hypothetical protein
VPDDARSSPLLRTTRGAHSSKPPIGLLVGIALAFLVVGAILAAVVLKVVGK